MSLQEKLDAIRAGSVDRIPPDALAIAHKATNDLRDSGILDQVLKPGDPAPEFELENIRGDSISSRSLLARGPLIVTFYRGLW